MKPAQSHRRHRIGPVMMPSKRGTAQQQQQLQQTTSPQHEHAMQPLRQLA
jgi:hypothetical protein